MKRMLKKLSAIALAGAMVLSLSVSALATAGQNGVPDQVATIPAATGNTTGTGSTTGGIPADVLKIKLPLNAAAGTFNLYFDPHNLIRQSGNALELGSADATFADDTLVYFQNSGDNVSFSKTSDAIKVINKSSVPISVNMTATWSKAAATYKLARTAEELAELKTKGEAGLYLYVEEDHTNGTSPVVEVDRGTPVPTITYTKGTAQGTSPSSTETDLTLLNKYIKSVKFEYTDNADSQDIENINYGAPDSTTPANGKVPANWQFTFTNVNNKTPTVTFSNAADKIPGYTSYNTSGNATTANYKAVATPNIEITTTNNPDGSKTYALKPDASGKVPEPKSVLKIQRGTNLDVAYITFEWDYEAIAANGFAVEEKVGTATDYDPWTIGLTFASGSGAKVETDLNRIDGAYHLVKDTATTMKWDLVDGYTYDEGDDDKFESVSFRLTAAITDGDVCAKKWDTAFPVGNANEGTLNLIWAAAACTAVEPSAKVTSALASANGTATLKVDWGYGDYKATTISAATYLEGSNTITLDPNNIAISDSTVTITSPGDPLFHANGANGILTLTISNPDTGYSKDVTVDLKTAAS